MKSAMNRTDQETDEPGAMKAIQDIQETTALTGIHGIR